MGKVTVSHKIMAQVSQYETESGKFSSYWAPIGMLFSDENGKPVRLKLHTLPVEDWDGWANVQSLRRGRLEKVPPTDEKAEYKVADGDTAVELGDVQITLSNFTPEPD